MSVFGHKKVMARFTKVEQNVGPVGEKLTRKFAVKVKSYVKQNLAKKKSRQSGGHSTPVKLWQLYSIPKIQGGYMVAPTGSSGNWKALSFATAIEKGFTQPHAIDNAFGIPGFSVWHPGVGQGRSQDYLVTKGFFTKAMDRFITRDMDQMIDDESKSI